MSLPSSEAGTPATKLISDSPPVWVGEDISDQLNRWLAANAPENVWILADTNTAAHCLGLVREKIPLLTEAPLITIGTGEQAKSLSSCEQVWRVLSDQGAGRKSLLCNLGGGIVGDLGGFAASSFMRGIPFIQLPTSLLAMVDASVGGKTGVNFAGIKNLVGSFQQPAGVFIQSAFLSSLPQDELLSGFAEMVKHALIEGGTHWERIQSCNMHDRSALPELIAESVRLKSAITGRDFRESGLREVLNLGHTTAHALESLFFSENRQIMHGYAVAAGLAIESHMAELINTGLMREEAAQIRKFIYRIFPPAGFKAGQTGKIIRLMGFDKKNRSGKVRFSLLAGIGKAIHGCEVPEKTIEEALEKYLNDVGHP